MHRVFHFVGLGSNPRPIFGGQLAHAPQHGGDFAFFAQEGNAQLLDRVEVRGLADRALGFGLQLAQLGFEVADLGGSHG